MKHGHCKARPPRGHPFNAAHSARAAAHRRRCHATERTRTHLFGLAGSWAIPTCSLSLCPVSPSSTRTAGCTVHGKSSAPANSAHKTPWVRPEAPHRHPRAHHRCNLVSPVPAHLSRAVSARRSQACVGKAGPRGPQCSIATSSWYHRFSQSLQVTSRPRRPAGSPRYVIRRSQHG